MIASGMGQDDMESVSVEVALKSGSESFNVTSMKQQVCQHSIANPKLYQITYLVFYPVFYPVSYP